MMLHINEIIQITIKICFQIKSNIVAVALFTFCCCCYLNFTRFFFVLEVFASKVFILFYFLIVEHFGRKFC